MTGSPDARRTRRLRDTIEPLAGCVYFAPETHRAFEDLGFGPATPGFRGVAAPNPDAYFTSRGACLGRVTGEAVTAAFGVFSPEVVVPAVDRGWEIADRAAVLEAREHGTVAYLERVLGGPDAPIDPDGVARATELLLRGAGAAGMAGRPLYAGLRSLGLPGSPMGDLWRAADLVREHRGDAHIAAWTGAGLSAPEVMLATELWWGLPRRSYALTRGWSPAEYDRADATLAAAGMVTTTGPDGTLTEDGLALRRRIEAATDAMEARVLLAIDGDDRTGLDELIGLLEPVAAAIVDDGGYPAGAFQTASDL